jgi:Na+-driven multidrug efflux pump
VGRSLWNSASKRSTQRTATTADPESLEQAALVEPPLPKSSLTPDGRLMGGQLAGLTMTGAIITLTWPILAESFLNSTVGLTDTILSAGINDDGASTDAVSGSSMILWFVQLVVQAIGVGATALISRAVGGRRVGVANAAVGQTMILAAVSGVLVGLGMLLIAKPASIALSLSPVASQGFRQFVTINAFGVPMGSVLFAAIACARGAGDSLRPLWAMIIVNVVNIAMSWSLAGVDLKSVTIVHGEPVVRWVLHNPFHFNLGVRGIAFGTLSAYTVGCLVMLAILWRGVGGSGGIRLRAARLKPHWHTLRRLIRMAVPNFLETLGMWVGNLMIMLMVGRMGAEHPGLLGSHFVAIRVEAFSFLPGFAFATAAATLVGQYLGAGSPKLASRAVLVCSTAAASFMGAMGLLFIFKPESIVGLMSSQQVHLTYTPPLLHVTGFVQIPFALSLVLRNAIRGAGDVKAAMVLTWVSTYLFRLPLAYAFSGVSIPLWGSGGHVFENPFPWHWGLTGVWIGLCTEIVFRAVLYWARFAQGHWSRQRV